LPELKGIGNARRQAYETAFQWGEMELRKVVTRVGMVLVVTSDSGKVQIRIVVVRFSG
jgi:chromosome condensin MukBEF MukE localization factor